MLHRFLSGVLLALLMAAAAPAAAQTGASWVPVISSGTRVRATIVDSPRPPLVGAFGGATADSLRLILTSSTSLSLEARSVAHLDVSEGRERGRWAVIGGLVGGLAGGLIGAAALGDDNDTTGLAAFAGFLAGSVLGLPTGAIVGAVYAPERWTRYSNPR